MTLTRLLSSLFYRSSALAWRANYHISRAVGTMRGSKSSHSVAFDKRPFHIGLLTSRTLERLKSAISYAADVEFSRDDHAKGYAFNHSAQPNGARFHSLDEARIALDDVIDELAPQIERKIGGPWRILNVRSWSLVSRGASVGDWHLDGFPISTFKLMLYVGPVGLETGTTEARFNDGTTAIVEGDPGTFLLFDPNTLWHRAIPPARPNTERTIIEITLTRCLATDRNLVFAGLNASYPFVPWIRKLEKRVGTQSRRVVSAK
jgi:hypothetical protein